MTANFFLFSGFSNVWFLFGDTKENRISCIYDEYKFITLGTPNDKGMVIFKVKYENIVT